MANYPYYRSMLARYLMTLAQIADEMDFEADQRLVYDNINTSSPLHIRRTLDQYYFLNLEDTSVRDKDQVVYRGTKPGRKSHSQQARVVMVDQLWLWILDDSQIPSPNQRSHSRY
jgi:hypothetical protein